MFPNFDPSKMDPKLLMELSQLVQKLPPDQLSKMQVLMHNAMAGLDVRRDMEEFERNLPPGFREKLMAVMAQSNFSPSSAPIETESRTLSEVSPEEMNLKDARLTILKAVAEGTMPPEEAEKLLFHAS
jgi:hypothetical protein